MGYVHERKPFLDWCLVLLVFFFAYVEYVYIR